MQAVVADRSRRLPDRHDLCMGGWIVGTDGLVESTAHDDVAENDNRANRNFSGLLGKARLIQRLSHEPLVVNHVVDAYAESPHPMRLRNVLDTMIVFYFCIGVGDNTTSPR